MPPYIQYTLGRRKIQCLKGFIFVVFFLIFVLVSTYFSSGVVSLFLVALELSGHAQILLEVENISKEIDS